MKKRNLRNGGLEVSTPGLNCIRLSFGYGHANNEKGLSPSKKNLFTALSHFTII